MLHTAILHASAENESLKIDEFTLRLHTYCTESKSACVAPGHAGGGVTNRLPEAAVLDDGGERAGQIGRRNHWHSFTSVSMYGSDCCACQSAEPNRRQCWNIRVHCVRVLQGAGAPEEHTATPQNTAMLDLDHVQQYVSGGRLNCGQDYRLNHECCNICRCDCGDDLCAGSSLQVRGVYLQASASVQFYA